MGVLYETVKLSNEGKKQIIIISDLLMMGITDHNGQDLNKLDYYTLRQLLSVKKAMME